MRRGVKDGRQARAGVAKAPAASGSAPISAQSTTFRLSVPGAVHKHRALPSAQVHPKGLLEPVKPPSAPPKAPSEPASTTARRRGIRPRSVRGAERQPPHGDQALSRATADTRPPGMPSDEAIEAAGEFLREVGRLRTLVEERPELLPDTKGVIVGAVLVAGIGDEAAHEALCSHASDRGLSQCRVVQASEEDLERLLFFATLYRADRTPFADLSRFLRARTDLETTPNDSASHREAQNPRLTLVLFETITLSTPELLSAVEDAILAAGGAIMAHPALPAPVILTTDPLEITDLRYLLFDPCGWSLIARGDIRPYQSASGWRALTRLANLRRWLLRHFTATEQERFLLIGSTALFMYGIRVPGDIDLYVHNPEGDQQFVAKVERALSQEEGTLFSSVDVILRGYGKWLLDGEGSEYVRGLERKYLILWPQSFGAVGMNEVFESSRFTERFLGTKCISLDCDLHRRARRNRPAAYADLIFVTRQERFKGLISIAVPRMGDHLFEDNAWHVIDDAGQKTFFSSVRHYLRSRFGMSLAEEEIRALLLTGPTIDRFNYPSGTAKDMVEKGTRPRRGEQKGTLSRGRPVDRRGNVVVVRRLENRGS